MELAMSAKEPYNYFLLLRALFRSIGGGSHDLLYQEFLPLLPNLLQGNTSFCLNRFVFVVSYWSGDLELIEIKCSWNYTILKMSVVYIPYFPKMLDR